MINSELLVNQSKNEKKLFVPVTQNNDVQLWVSNGADSLVVIDNKLIQPHNLFIGYVDQNVKVCNVRYDKHHFSFPSGQSSQLSRIWLDDRDGTNATFHININGQYKELSKDDERTDELLIVFIECQNFVQLSMYDGRIMNGKVSHILASSTPVMNKIKTIAQSMLNQQFPGLNDNLYRLESESHEKV